MKLHFSPGACSMAPHIVAHEAGVQISLDKLDVKNKKTQDGTDFFKVNPKGYVPALALDDGSVLTEASVICQYLADQGKGLMPAHGTMDRYHAQEMFNFISTELHKGMGALFDPSIEAPRREKVIEGLMGRLQTLEPVLSKQSFLLGPTMTAPDAYLFTVLNWGSMVKVNLPAFLGPYMDRMRSRPSVQSAMKAEGLLS
jgi:glutathione S-transferase